MPWTEEYIDIPYKLHGRDKVGLDCWGLVYLIYLNRFKIELPSYTEEYKSNNTSQDAQILNKLYQKETADSKNGWRDIPIGEEKDGDVLLLPFAGVHVHVGLCIGQNKMIHVMDGINVTREGYISTKWSPRYSRSMIYRHPEVLL